MANTQNEDKNQAIIVESNLVDIGDLIDSLPLGSSLRKVHSTGAMLRKNLRILIC
jgi:hypothetical protein